MYLKKPITKVMLVASFSFLLFASCQKQNSKNTATNTVSSNIIGKIQAAGFSTDGVVKVKEGYLVEGDIVLTDAFLNSGNTQPKTIVATETTPGNRPKAAEQYRVTNPVTGSSTPCTPTFYNIIANNLGANYLVAIDTAIARYNALNLSVRFQRITSGTADITVTGYYDNTTTTEGYSGFPTNGVPYNSIQLNTYYYGTNPTNILFTASVIQHEIGHCIGMRHTDYADRSFSCGGSAVNEGASTVGAVQIPGTPSGPDAGSWMLACNAGINRTFNANDIIALNYLFPYTCVISGNVIALQGTPSYVDAKNITGGTISGGGSGTVSYTWQILHANLDPAFTFITGPGTPGATTAAQSTNDFDQVSNTSISHSLSLLPFGETVNIRRVVTVGPNTSYSNTIILPLPSYTGSARTIVAATGEQDVNGKFAINSTVNLTMQNPNSGVTYHWYYLTYTAPNIPISVVYMGTGTTVQGTVGSVPGSRPDQIYIYGSDGSNQIFNIFKHS